MQTAIEKILANETCNSLWKTALPWPAPSLASPEDIDEANEDSQGQDCVAGFDAAGTTDVAEEGVAAVHGGSRYAEVNPGAGANGRASFRDGLARLAACI